MPIIIIESKKAFETLGKQSFISSGLPITLIRNTDDRFAFAPYEPPPNFPNPYLWANLVNHVVCSSLGMITSRLLINQAVEELLRKMGK